MSGQKLKIEKQVSLKNKQAFFEYFMLETFVAGIVLRGTEIKSIRMMKVNFTDSFCQMKGGELYLVNFHIAPYEKGTYLNHDPKADRKLLLRKKEIAKIDKALKERGTTLVPTKLFINERGLCKLEVALAKGKKLHDKRETIKERDLTREMRRGE